MLVAGRRDQVRRLPSHELRSAGIITGGTLPVHHYEWQLTVDVEPSSFGQGAAHRLTRGKAAADGSNQAVGDGGRLVGHDASL